jgi:hypothetical protein
VRRYLASRGLPIVSLVMVLLALVRIAAAADVTYSFELLGPQITASSSGASIAMTGAGSFNTTTGTVVASGSFAQFNANGSVAAHGMWSATSFVSFDSFGGANPGLQGGQLVMIVTLFPKGGPPQTGLSMSITCLVGSPPPGAIEGVTIGNFTTPVRGHTLFHLNQ